MWNRIEEMWCRMMHEQAMWPMHGRYTCRQCLREYPVEWNLSHQLSAVSYQLKPVRLKAEAES